MTNIYIPMTIITVSPDLNQWRLLLFPWKQAGKIFHGSSYHLSENVRSLSSLERRMTKACIATSRGAATMPIPITSEVGKANIKAISSISNTKIQIVIDFKCIAVRVVL